MSGESVRRAAFARRTWRVDDRRYPPRLRRIYIGHREVEVLEDDAGVLEMSEVKTQRS